MDFLALLEKKAFHFLLCGSGWGKGKTGKVAENITIGAAVD